MDVISCISLAIAIICAYLAYRSTNASERSAQAAEKSATSAKDTAEAAKEAALTSRGQYILNRTEDAHKVYKAKGSKGVDEYLETLPDLNEEEKENIKRNAMRSRVN